MRVNADVLYVDGGDVLTSAGSAAGIDLCLHIVRRDHGSAIANAVARRLVIPPHRDGGQAQLIELPMPAHPDDDPIAGVMAWALERLDEPLDLAALAARAYMSVRTFTRRFRQATGHDAGALADRAARAREPARCWRARTRRSRPWRRRVGFAQRGDVPASLRGDHADDADGLPAGVLRGLGVGWPGARGRGAGGS